MRFTLLLIALALACVIVNAGECAYKDACGVCNGDNSTCNCHDYLGFPVEEVDLSLLQWLNADIKKNIWTTIENLEKMKEAVLTVYDPNTMRLDLADYIDGLHAFCGGRTCDDIECADPTTSSCSMEECSILKDCLSLSDFSLLELSFLSAIKLQTGNTNPCLDLA